MSTESSPSPAVEPIAARVIDASCGIAGAYAALVLHQVGAAVRWAVRGADDPDLPPDAPLTAYLRQGQRAMAYDPEAIWSSGADVVIVSPADEVERAAALAARRADPGLIVCAITPYGLTGPDADRPATDLTLQADSGALAIRGSAGQEPFQLGGRTIEWIAGAYAAAAALALWRARRAGGPGALIDVSRAEVANTAAANYSDVMHALGHGPDVEPVGSPRVLETPSIERTRDGWVGFNTNAPHQIAGFLRMIGRADLLERREFMTQGVRAQRIDEWQPMVTAWTSQRSTEEVIEAAVAHHVPVAPVCNGRTITELAHVVARNNLVPDPTGRFLMPRRSWRIDGELGPDPAPAAASAPSDAAPPVDALWPERADPVPVGPGAGALPLAGLRVLDLTAWWAGPSATGFLAALGADVIHVEAPARMDGMRLVGASFADRPEWWERSWFFLTINTNKRDVVLDLGAPQGRDLALRLVAQADVVVENFTPRVLEKIGLGWEAVRAANPRAVLVRMPAFGLDGPWSDRPGFAQNIEQALGLAWLTGRADDQPRIQRGPCDPNGGLHAVIALLHALDRRDRTGRGCLVESPLFDAALPLAAEAIVEWTANGVVQMRDGNRCARYAPQGVYRTLGDDAWVALSVLDGRQWRALAVLMGRADLAEDATLEGLGARRARHDDIDDAIGAWTADRSTDDVLAALQTVGIPAASARDPRRVVDHPQFAARGYHEVVAHPVCGPVPIPTLPLRIEGIERWTRSPAPTFGANTDEVLQSELGLDDDALAALRAVGVVADRPVGV